MSNTNAGFLREQLIQSLSDEEIATLGQEVKKNFGLRAKGGEALKVVNAKKLFSFLHFKIFGTRGDRERYVTRVVESMDKVKEFIHGLPSAPIFKVKDEYPQMPQNLIISNEGAGTVVVRFHAWKRLIERWPGRLAHNPPEVVAKILQDSFAGATPTTLARPHRVTRLINNDFVQAEYYINARAQLRFVVSTENGRKALVTVERPY